MLKSSLRSMTDMARSRAPRRKKGIVAVKVLLNGKLIPPSEAVRKIGIPLTKTSKELLSALVKAEEPVSPKQLASELKRTQTTIYRSIKNLEHRGLALKIRRGLVALTEGGYKTAKKLEKKL
jgi:DNA-binding MarR family transcriptional regulator